MIHKQTNTPIYPHTHQSTFAAIRLTTWTENFSKSKENTKFTNQTKESEREEKFIYVHFVPIYFVRKSQIRNIIDLSKDM